MKAGLFLIATGKYDKFIIPLLNSVEQYFLQGFDRKIYLFTDKPFKGLYDNLEIENHIIKRLGFPGDTLFRYKRFVGIKKLIDTDYLFYLDIDMLISDFVGVEILPDESGLVCVKHPGFYKGGGSWETDPRSTAFVSPEKQRVYVAGGFNGGTTEDFMRMAEKINKNIDEDKRNGITAVWHDESHLNCYIANSVKPKLLNPSYCYPESWKLPYKAKILALDKDHKKIRS